MRHIFALFTLLASAFVQAHNYSDWWADSELAGSSINIAQQDDVLFFAWYLYGQDEKAKWIYGVGKVDDDHADVEMYEASGPNLGPASDVVSTPVGKGVFTFLSTGALQFRYDTSVAGIGTLNLKRFSFQRLPLSGSYYGSYWARRYNCPSSAQEVIYSSPSVLLDISASSIDISIRKTEGSSVCSYAGTFAQEGSRFRASGSFACKSGSSGTWSATDSFVDNGRLVIELSTHVNGGCDSHTYFFGAREGKI